MYEDLTHPDLTSLDHGKRATAIDRALTHLRAHERRLSAVKASLAARLADVDGRFATGTYTAPDHDTRADLREALGQLERGPHKNEGVLPEVAPFVGLPGLPQTRAEVERLSAEYGDTVLMRDHANDKAEYRLKPNVGEHYVPGPDGLMRRLQPGETTEMTLAQYRAFEDKFEPVEVEAPSVEPTPEEAVSGA